MNRQPSFTFAASTYANSAPLVDGIRAAAPQAQLLDGQPSDLAPLLIDGSVDAALVPVVSLFEHEELRMLPDAGVCATDRVWSVLLKCRRPVRQVRTVARDAASRTSNALAEIVLRRHFGLDVQMQSPPCADRADARVVIGDRALCLPPDASGRYDLAQLWHEMTALPFVFAVWACRADHPKREAMSATVRKARDLGVASIDDIASLQAARLGLDARYCQDYLSSAIHYHVGPSELEAMGLFRKLWQELPSAQVLAEAAS